MAKKLLIGLLATVMLLIGANVLAVEKLTNMEYTEDPWGDMIGFNVKFGECRSDPWHSLWIWGEPGVQNANRYEMVAPIDIYSICGWFYNYPGYAVPGINVIFHIWDDDGAGLPLEPPIYSSASFDLPEALGWVSRFHVGGCCDPTMIYHIDSAGDYHFGYELTGDSASAFTFCTSDTGGFTPSPDPDSVSSTYDWDPGFEAWYTVGDFGFDPSMRWDIYACGEYTECVHEIALPPCCPPCCPDGMPGMLKAGPGSQVAVPVYVQTCGDPLGNLDALTFKMTFNPDEFEVDSVQYEVSGPDAAGNNYTTFFDVIGAPFVETGGINNATGVVTWGAVGSMLGDPDWPSDVTYRAWDVWVTVADTIGVFGLDRCYYLTLPLEDPPVNYLTYGTTNAFPTLISGGICVPSHEMNGVTFDPDPAEVDECECIAVEVFGGCSAPDDAHTLTVTDWDGADVFGTFVQDGFTGDNTHGVFEFCPNACQSGVYHIVVRDDCEEYGVFEEATLCLTVNEEANPDNETVVIIGDKKWDENEVFPGSDITVPVTIFLCETSVGGFNILIHYDSSVLTLTGVEEVYDFEYFYWTDWQVDDGNKVRVVAIANKPNQVDTDPMPPLCEATFNLKFHVSAKWDCNFWIPIDFEVDDACMDNTLTDGKGEHLFAARTIYTFNGAAGPDGMWVEGEDWDICWTTYCDTLVPHPGEIDYYGKVLRCKHIYGPNGDVNCDMIRYTIADAVFFMEYLKGVNEVPSQGCAPDYQDAASDINFDGHQWTIADLIMLVNILNGSATPVGEGKVLASTANIAVSGNTIATDATIGGLYLTVKGGGEPILNAAGMDMETSLVNGERRIIVMSWDSNTATGDLVTIPGSFEITSVEVSDPAGYLMKVSTVPSEFALAQNYPNPFNPNTNIAFSLPNDANVSLTVYNIAGEKVAELVNGQVKAGHHTVTWNATDVASGVYFYKITAGNFTATRKMVFMK